MGPATVARQGRPKFEKEQPTYRYVAAQIDAFTTAFQSLYDDLSEFATDLSNWHREQQKLLAPRMPGLGSHQAPAQTEILGPWPPADKSGG